MTQHALDLTSELLRGMRLSGVNYRRIETSRPFGVEFGFVPGKAQFHFISRGPVLLRMVSGQRLMLQSGDALFILTAMVTCCSPMTRQRWLTSPDCPANRFATR